MYGGEETVHYGSLYVVRTGKCRIRFRINQMAVVTSSRQTTSKGGKISRNCITPRSIDGTAFDHSRLVRFAYQWLSLSNAAPCHLLDRSSMSQELFVSVSQLVEMADNKGIKYDHIVIESSGISEPKSVRSLFQDSESYGMKLMDEVIYKVVVCRCLCWFGR